MRFAVVADVTPAILRALVRVAGELADRVGEECYRLAPTAAVARAALDLLGRRRLARLRALRRRREELRALGRRIRGGR